jgi:hypothetical protein
MFPIPRRTGIISRWNGIFTDNLAMNSLDGQFTAPGFYEHLSGRLDGLALGLVETPRPIRIHPFVRPLAIRSPRNKPPAIHLGILSLMKKIPFI